MQQKIQNSCSCKGEGAKYSFVWKVPLYHINRQTDTNRIWNKEELCGFADADGMVS